MCHGACTYHNWLAASSACKACALGRRLRVSKGTAGSSKSLRGRGTSQLNRWTGANCVWSLRQRETWYPLWGVHNFTVGPLRILSASRNSWRFQDRIFVVSFCQESLLIRSHRPLKHLLHHSVRCVTHQLHCVDLPPQEFNVGAVALYLFLVGSYLLPNFLWVREVQD